MVIPLDPIPLSAFNSSTDAGRMQMQFIDAARQLLQPSPVDLHHVPGWFRLVLLENYGCQHGPTDGSTLLTTLAQTLEWRWVDHWGSTSYHGVHAFVSEPYGLRAADLGAIAEMCRACNLEYIVSPNSWWYPSHTIRILIFPKTDTLSHGPVEKPAKTEE